MPVLTERTAALFESLERQAQQGIDEIAHLRRQLAAMQAENERLRARLAPPGPADRAPARAVTSPTPTPPARSSGERDYPLPRLSPTADSSTTAAPEPPETAASPAHSQQDPQAPAAVDAASTPQPQQSRLAIGEAPSPQALLDEWYRRYTDTFFKGHTRPLKVGIHEDLVAREPWPDKLVRRALACYVHLPRYLKAVRVGAERVDLDGNPAGGVTEGEARHAHKKLETLQAQQRQREKSRRPSDKPKGAGLEHKLSELLAKHGKH